MARLLLESLFVAVNCRLEVTSLGLLVAFLEPEISLSRLGYFVLGRRNISCHSLNLENLFGIAGSLASFLWAVTVDSFLRRFNAFVSFEAVLSLIESLGHRRRCVESFNHFVEEGASILHRFLAFYRPHELVELGILFEESPLLRQV